METEVTKILSWYYLKVKIELTLHAKEKLKTKESKLLKITKKIIIDAIKKPIGVDRNLSPHRSTDKLNDDLSLAVIWKEEDGIIRIITFFPAEKGRYESKILRRR